MVAADVRSDSPPRGDHSAILAMEDACFVPRRPDEVATEGNQLCLKRGMLVVVRVDSAQCETPLADAAAGLRSPASGAVRWHGSEWQTMDPWHAGLCRGRIGRVFSGCAWVSNLNVDENVLLGALHHVFQRRAALQREANDLALWFGLDGLPAKRPNMLSSQDLQLAQCVRAFSDSPDLLVLEHPARDLADAEVDRLIGAVLQARARGAAVLWFTALESIVDHPRLLIDECYEARGPALHRVSPVL
jgi:phospholipid/cholesterol/gamma-HCH transport system ATP-binding protein